MLCRSKQTIVALGFALCLSGLYTHQAFAVGAPKPATGNALAQYYLPHLNNTTNYGPIVQLAPVTIENVPHPVQIQKDLSDKLIQTPVSYTQITVNSSAKCLSSEKTGAITSAYQNRPLGIEDVQKLAGELHTACLDQGWISTITISETADQQLQIDHELFKLQDVIVEDGKYFKARAIKPFIGGKKDEPINVTRLQRNIRQLQSNPDLVLGVELEPVEFNKANIRIKVTEDKNPLHASTFFNNLNLNVYGNYFYGGGVVHNNLLGFGDTLSLTGMAGGRGGTGFFGRYETPINSHGTRVFTELGLVNAQPENFAFRDFNYNKAQAWIWSTGLKQILFDKNETRLAADATFDIKQMDTQDDGVDLEREQYRQLRLGLQLDRNDKSGYTSLREEIGWGLNVFGATLAGSPKASTDNAGGQYIRFTTTLARIQKMMWGTEGQLLATLQYSPSHLPAMEQYFAGGTFTGRGYREGLYGGDTFGFVSAQWNVPAFFIPKNWKIPKTEVSLRDNIKLVFFADYVYTHLNKLAAGSDASENMLGVGAGIRAKLTKYLNARLDLAFPVLRQNNYSQQPRIHFGLESAIF